MKDKTANLVTFLVILNIVIVIIISHAWIKFSDELIIQPADYKSEVVELNDCEK